nr:ribosomal protein L7/L12 [Gammaproteobacteria bacterium]
MASRFTVNIKPVPERVADRVSEVILQFIGPANHARASELVHSGGTILEGLNNETAETVAYQLREAGAQVELQPMDDAAVDSFRVRLVSFGESKIRVIRAVREIAGLGLTKSKELVENLGIVKSSIDSTAAEKIKARLEAAGATAAVEQAGIPDSENPEEGDQFIVFGRVTRADGKPAHGTFVSASDRDLRNEQPLGQPPPGLPKSSPPGSFVDQDGNYAITYTRNQFRHAEKHRADLLLRVYNEVNVQLKAQPAKVIYNAQPEEKVDLQITEGEAVLPSEYERLLAFLAPVLDGVAPADLSEDDIKFLSYDTEIGAFEEEFPVGADSIAFLADGADLAVDTDIPTEVFYGWARMKVGVVREDERVRLDLYALFERDSKVLEQKLLAALEDNIIPARLRKRLDGILRRLEQIRAERRRRQRELWPQHEVALRLLDEETGKPLVGYTVQAEDPDGFPLPEDLGLDITDGQGRFAFVMRAPPEEVEERTTRTLRLQIESAAGAEILKQVQIRLGEEEALEVRVEVPEPRVPGEDVGVSDLPVELSPDVQRLFKEHNIRTLADVRSIGGLNRIEGVSEDILEHAEVRKLQAHASLYSLSPNLQTRERIALHEKLIAKGYHSPLALADEAEDQLALTFKGEIDLEELQRMHHMSRMHDYLASNAWVDRITRARHDRDGGQDGQAGAEPIVKCTCKDCDSALSPGAYLADLLGYVLKHLRVNGQATTLDWLVQTFHQPFDSLPVSCAASKQEVRQVRLCIEVLLRHLGEGGVQFLQMLGSKGEAYRRAASDALLSQIGTSREELRLTLASSEQEQRALASRLGIEQERLKELFFNPEAHPLTSGALSERNLEEVFGLRALTYVKVVTDLPRVIIPDPLRELDPPHLETWRFDHLRKQWQQQDHPGDPYTGGELPRIDPDLINPEDFRTPDPNASSAYALWLKRRDWVDARLQELELIQAGAGDNPAAALQKLFDHLEREVTYDGTGRTPWASGVTESAVNDINAQLTVGENVESMTQRIKDLHLTVDGFNRLAEVTGRAAAGESVEDEAWQDVFSILVQVQKRLFFATWSTEEESADPEANPAGLLDPRIFWIALREPGSGLWSPALYQQRPLIDPDVVGREDLLAKPLGENARATWDARRQALSQARQSITTAYEQGKLEAGLQAALSNPPDPNLAWPDFLDQLDSDLKSRDAQTRHAAEQRLSDDLQMSEDDLRYLMAIKAREAAGQEPESANLDELFSLLTSAYKRKQFNDGWKQEESDLNLAYWKVLKPRLPRWRAQQSNRQGWQQALRSRSRPPIIDPDLIRDEDFESAMPGDPALEIWQKRYVQIEGDGTTTGKLQEIGTPDIGAAADQQATLNHKLSTYLDISLDELLELDQYQNEGNRIDGRLEQLTLSRDDFAYIVRVAAAVAEGAEVTEDTWPNVYAILLQVWKRRRYASWHYQEKTAGLSLSPQYFKASPRAYPADSEQAAPTARWRSDRRERRAWEQTLRARIEQKQTMRQALRMAVDSVEEQTLPQLRDALIEASSSAPDDALSVKAKWATDRFLIDMQESGCRMITRVGQAAEMLQSLVVSIRTRRLDLGTGIRLTLKADHFEEQWNWIGAYATWKAAMSVFVYPENILLPGLRRRKTPAFESLLARTQGRPISPQDACE